MSCVAKRSNLGRDRIQANAWRELPVSGMPARRLHGAVWSDASNGMFVVAGRDDTGSELSDKVEQRPKPPLVGPDSCIACIAEGISILGKQCASPIAAPDLFAQLQLRSRFIIPGQHAHPCWHVGIAQWEWFWQVA